MLVKRKGLLEVTLFSLSVEVSLITSLDPNFNTFQCSGLETKYKFHRTVKVSPGEVVAVWNADAGVEHQPNEGQLVMKQGGFIFKDTVETVLLDKDSEVAATRETKKEAETRGTARAFAGRRLHAQAEGDKNCAIM